MHQGFLRFFKILEEKNIGVPKVLPYSLWKKTSRVTEILSNLQKRKHKGSRISFKFFRKESTRSFIDLFRFFREEYKKTFKAPEILLHLKKTLRIPEIVTQSKKDTQGFRDYLSIEKKTLRAPDIILKPKTDNKS